MRRGAAVRLCGKCVFLLLAFLLWHKFKNPLPDPASPPPCEGAERPPLSLHPAPGRHRLSPTSTTKGLERSSNKCCGSDNQNPRTVSLLLHTFKHVRNFYGTFFLFSPFTELRFVVSGKIADGLFCPAPFAHHVSSSPLPLLQPVTTRRATALFCPFSSLRASLSDLNSCYHVKDSEQTREGSCA